MTKFSCVEKLPAVTWKSERGKPGKGKFLAVNTAYPNAANGAKLCLFGLIIGGNVPVFDWINAATGFWRCPRRSTSGRESIPGRSGCPTESSGARP